MNLLNELIVYQKPKSPISEAYRSLRTNIEFANVDNDKKLILITSSKQAEGKSTTVANLAVTMANMGKKVVIVDGDLRRPRVHKIFGHTKIGGVTEILLSHCSYKGCVKKTEVENLDIITSGQTPPNPSEMLSSNSMKQILEEVRNDYDYVFIDSPPVAAVADAVILSGMADGVVLVCACGRVEVDMVRNTLQALENAGAYVIGSVINNIDVHDKKSGYYYYSPSYYGYCEDSNEKRKRKKRKKKQAQSGLKAASGND
ncbi:capsular exopolysaccharide family [Peptoclostridium litorale DSM 5388]|uniref:non-specific protein-tyrosine kinase n=1 Tax=Peptoclostridium litorale DSM 5388 TaxID=1121324 RepID=A0A069RKE1_PEPLI|nr:CpsD/CapB family tyrosine-protein kinase [Peptoclostridium litorale]KDR94672.1 capsular exopolysaccharide family protein [Peptoclostridium litorale DSM 5388]SIO29954.1 capsular exopolysaccharide family [Peptoclostridium litorale DSM 5388]